MNISLDEIWFRHDPNVQIKALNERILIMPSQEMGGFGWRTIHKQSTISYIDKWLTMYYKLDSSDYIALAKVFLKRMRSELKRLVYNKVNKTLNEISPFDRDNSQQFRA